MNRQMLTGGTAYFLVRISCTSHYGLSSCDVALIALMTLEAIIHPSVRSLFQAIDWRRAISKSRAGLKQLAENGNFCSFSTHVTGSMKEMVPQAGESGGESPRNETFLPFCHHHLFRLSLWVLCVIFFQSQMGQIKLEGPAKCRKAPSRSLQFSHRVVPESLKFPLSPEACYSCVKVEMRRTHSYSYEVAWLEIYWVKIRLLRGTL